MSATIRVRARMAGLLYLIVGIGGGFAEVFVRGKLVVSGDAAATAANILAHESLYRFGGAAEIISLVGDAALALIFYELFKPAGKSLSLLAAFFRLTFVAVMAGNTLNHFAVLVFLKDAPAHVLQALRLHSLGYNIALVFFGFTCIFLGCLVYRSTFMPRLVGIVMAIAGIGYLINSFVHFLAPAYGAYAFRYILVPAGLGEMVFILWLLVMGVNSERWKERAGQTYGR